MTLTQKIIFITEIIGTVAFAFSGSIIGIRRKMDVFGVIILGEFTAVGGGAIRDILLGLFPPMLFRNPVYVTVAFVTSLTVFCFVYRWQSKLTNRSMDKFMPYLDFCDSIGLAAFTVVGADTAIANGFVDNSFLVVFVATLTGVGGGVLRDLMAGITPVIFRKQIYALASIIGGIFYVNVRRYSTTYAIFTAFFLVILIRALARKFRLDLPVAKINKVQNNKTKEE